jgi:2-polyprenyl-6-methoxyphenol hydroxylase-like FAD-dependent oxidoreductase
MLERTGRFPRTGAAIGLSVTVLGRLAHLEGSGSIPSAFSSIPTLGATWSALHDRLRAAVEADPRIEVHNETGVQSVDQDAGRAWAVTTAARTFPGDVVVGADGHRSVVRAHVSPERPEAAFAGYMIWLGLSQESGMPSVRRWPEDIAMLSPEDSYFFGYPVPDVNGAFVPGARELGWAWYDAGRNGLLRETGCIVGHVVQRSLTPDRVPAATLRELAQEARYRLPSPWREAVLETIQRRSVIGTPIAEYEPERIVRQRVVLVGDAAHVPTPMTGMGFAASLDDAEALADALTTTRAGASVVGALQMYERRRLDPARRLVRSGQLFSRSFSREAA